MSKDTDFKRVRRAAEVYKLLGYKASDFDGKSDAETRKLIDKALERAKYRRSDAEIVADRGVTVTLGSKDYHVTQRTIDDEGAWMDRCGVIAGEIVEILFEKAGPAFKDMNLDGALMALDPAAVLDQVLPILKALLPKALPYVFGKFSRDLVALFFEYSGIDREEAKANGATHLQVFSAATVVFNTFILPFMVGMIRAMWAGVQATGIMPSE